MYALTFCSKVITAILDDSSTVVGSGRSGWFEQTFRHLIQRTGQGAHQHQGRELRFDKEARSGNVTTCMVILPGLCLPPSRPGRAGCPTPFLPESWPTSHGECYGGKVRYTVSTPDGTSATPGTPPTTHSGVEVCTVLCTLTRLWIPSFLGCYE